MAVIATRVDRKNPSFNKQSYKIYMPQFGDFVDTVEGDKIFQAYKVIANGKVFKSVFGVEWDYAMSLVISHYLVIWASRASQKDKGMSSNLLGIAAMGNHKGILSSYSVGEVSKSYSYDGILINEKGAEFWNRTEFGIEFYSLLTERSGNIGIAVVS